MDGAAAYSAAAWNQVVTSGSMLGFNALGRLAGIRVPTLILAGAHDWIMPADEGARRLHAEIPESELVVFEESGHFPFIEEADRFRDVVRRWISALPSREPAISQWTNGSAR
jgi:pimeloyl-ACP methyl ester carboxylesterase